MILRLSAKLSKKIGVTPTESLPMPDNPFLDWSGQVFRANRVEYIIVTNTASLFSLLFIGRGVTTPEKYEEALVREFGGYLARCDEISVYSKYLASYKKNATYSKALNQSVTGSINDLIFSARFALELRGMTTWEASDYINEMPMSFLKMKSPETAFQTLKV
ncbi:MAG: hypothetical protein SCM96_13445 [Acidobacteriota bacterium]|nr:hypothetical protein [Acidobacteriota bacterium]